MSHVHFVRKGCARRFKIAILPRFWTSNVHFVRKGCVSWRSGGTAPGLKRDRKKSERRSADVRVWRCRSADVRVWRCRSADVRVWRCRSAGVRMWRCRSADVRVWRCRSADVRVWRCRSADVKMWRCRSADVRVWRCRSADVRVWRCRSADVRMWRCRSAGLRMWCEGVKMYYNGCFFTKNPSQALSGKTKQFCETSFKNGKLSAALTASYQCVLRFFYSTSLKYCACHEKLMPGHTKCCTCHAESS